MCKMWINEKIVIFLLVKKSCNLWPESLHHMEVILIAKIINKNNNEKHPKYGQIKLWKELNFGA